MTDSIPHTLSSKFKQAAAFLLHPRQGIRRLAAEQKPKWLAPMLVVCAAMLLRVVVGGFFQARATAMGQVNLPPDWQWWTPDMQNNYMQAQQATQGPAFVYLIPAVLELCKIWLGWFAVGGLLHLASTLMGGRGSMRSALNLVGWSWMVFAIRDVLRVIFMLISGHAVVNPGLSGFAATTFLSELLGNLDIFILWTAYLLGIGISEMDSLPITKAAVAVAVVLLGVVLVKAGLGTLTANLSGMMVTRTFI